MMGDGNYDQNVDILDVVFLCNIILGNVIADPCQRASYNFIDDEILNIVDLISLVQLVMGRHSEPATSEGAYINPWAPRDCTHIPDSAQGSWDYTHDTNTSMVDCDWNDNWGITNDGSEYTDGWFSASCLEWCQNVWVTLALTEWSIYWDDVFGPSATPCIAGAECKIPSSGNTNNPQCVCYGGYSERHSAYHIDGSKPQESLQYQALQNSLTVLYTCISGLSGTGQDVDLSREDACIDAIAQILPILQQGSAPGPIE
jgi:hypothetical protein